MQPQFFGNPDQPLFGVFHRARGSISGAARAVVICPPIGQEYIRTHWCLRLLAGQLSRQGIHVFRFDYTGIGDSAKSIFEVTTASQWISDIDLAVQQMKKLTAVDSVMLIGLRTGATLAANFSLNSPEVNSLVLWEPVHHQQDHLEQWRTLHEQMLDLWICKMDTEDSECYEELLGSQYSRTLLQELESLNLPWDEIQPPHLVLETDQSNGSSESKHNPMRKVEYTGDEDSWNDLKQLETAWLRPQTTRKLVNSTTDFFERLIRFGIVKEPELIGVTR